MGVNLNQQWYIQRLRLRATSPFDPFKALKAQKALRNLFPLTRP